MLTLEKLGLDTVEITLPLFERLVPADTVEPDTPELTAESTYSLLQASVFTDGAFAIETDENDGVVDTFSVFPVFDSWLPALIAEPDATNVSTYDLFVASVELLTIPEIVKLFTEGFADSENVLPDLDKPLPAEILFTALSTYDLVVALVPEDGGDVRETEFTEISLFKFKTLPT